MPLILKDNMRNSLLELIALLPTIIQAGSIFNTDPLPTLLVPDSPKTLEYSSHIINIGQKSDDSYHIKSMEEQKQQGHQDMKLISLGKLYSQYYVKELLPGYQDELIQNLGAPTACTFYAGVAVDYILKNENKVESHFEHGDKVYFQEMYKTIFKQGLDLYAEAKHKGWLKEGCMMPNELRELQQSFKLFEKDVEKSEDILWAELGFNMDKIDDMFRSTETGRARATFMVQDGKTFVLLFTGKEDQVWYYNSHPTNITNELGADFGKMSKEGLKDVFQNYLKYESQIYVMEI